KPQLGSAEWPDAVIDDPFEDAKLKQQSELGEFTSPESTPTTLPVQPAPVSKNVSTRPLVDLETKFCRGIGELRQEVALLLAEHDDAIVKQLTFRIYCEKREYDLATLPAGLRGSIVGPGDITADLTLSKTGDYSKAEAEHIVEKLPMLPEADYKAELKIDIGEPAAVHAHANA